jgi:Pro-kumamolisin, activation domain
MCNGREPVTNQLPPSRVLSFFLTEAQRSFSNLFARVHRRKAHTDNQEKEWEMCSSSPKGFLAICFLLFCISPQSTFAKEGQQAKKGTFEWSFSPQEKAGEEKDAFHASLTQVTFALKQSKSGLEVLQKHFNKASDPLSNEYGDWWSRESISDLVTSVAKSDRNALIGLVRAKIDSESVQRANSVKIEDFGDAIRVSGLSWRMIESLLGVELGWWQVILSPAFRARFWDLFPHFRVLLTFLHSFLETAC